MLTLDPYHERIIAWKTKQNAIVSMFLDAWFAAPESLRTQQPFTVVADPLEDNFIFDRHGTAICQFAMINLSCCVFWIRSLEDMAALEQATTELGDEDAGTTHYRHQSTAAA